MAGRKLFSIFYACGIEVRACPLITSRLHAGDGAFDYSSMTRK